MQATTLGDAWQAANATRVPAWLAAAWRLRRSGAITQLGRIPTTAKLVVPEFRVRVSVFLGFLQFMRFRVEGVGFDVDGAAADVSAVTVDPRSSSDRLIASGSRCQMMPRASL